MQTVRRQLDRLFAVHMVIAVVTGALCFLTPHSLMAPMLGDGNNTHMAHEFVRLYGALTLAQGWMVWRTRLVSDALIRRTFCQAYCICFLLQAVALLRAQIASPESHSMLHWINILLLGGLGCAYGYFLVFKTIKAFELPGMEKGLL
ncbi:hypothetical protein F441_14987 [Phytophthora nicotianae CJ01A1]|uniref:Uncharacterized protein n=6 Tax=Phytophthora nicotianae TaxID=4792 RepID=W2PTY0_PHYN3|nr:hypothetical protein PPTG_15904 [Phytophthora nicotianae INRA-310]ETI39230.1 hypothetical protein F443_15178 [Phytophthora nicotianae P1569]ETK79437.1 hypothetical protein L915_14719 [Phytophthora nicotianae]ETO67971.1 hypothetical protein F444_15156 [Phytophthora nicotianae P1976]ETP09142.1 hypothetical protein F441_14987 [Phytophthora nicotianae CJ01A1]ETP37174.1 hypothetical protein F442_15011 [Phytophthora nicotianae P10297]KUF77343.1 hypothetical protein AM587_10010166 [Phytophthora n